jgi:hypothetical protein
MKKKFTALAMLIVLFLSIPMLIERTRAAGTTVSLPDAELYTEFNEGWGDAFTVTDIAGIGVQFNYTGLAKGAKCDGYELSPLAGGSGTHYADFTAYTQYSLIFKNIGTTAVDVDLFMNTGFTGSDPKRDAYWECDWVTLSPEETKTVTLNFSAAKIYDGGDIDPDYGHIPDGTVMPIYRLDEVTKIGFQVAYWSGTTNGAVIVSQSTVLYFDPVSTDKEYSDVDSTFTVTMKIEDVTNLYGFDIKITWDDALIVLSAASYSTFLTSIWGAFDDFLTTNGTGYYRFIAVSTQNNFSSTGSQSLLDLTFRVKDPLTNSLTGTPLHFEIHILSDKDSREITNVVEDGAYTIQGNKPTLSMSPTSRTCRKINETLDVSLVISDASSVLGLEFEIHFNTTLLNFTSITYDAWTSGTESVDEANGIILGSTSGTTEVDGSQTLVTIRFKAAWQHLWKNLAGWQNNQSDSILYQEANLTYASPQPKLQYVRGGAEQEITVGPDVVYTFAPIKGDLNNDGSVTVQDLRTLCYIYDTSNAEYNLVGDADIVINVLDLVVVSSNMWFTYTP